jgi:hypothetical protein
MIRKEKSYTYYSRTLSVYVYEGELVNKLLINSSHNHYFIYKNFWNHIYIAHDQRTKVYKFMRFLWNAFEIEFKLEIIQHKMTSSSAFYCDICVKKNTLTCTTIWNTTKKYETGLHNNFFFFFNKCEINYVTSFLFFYLTIK